MEAFHSLYYDREEQTWRNTRWLGVPILKCPLDLWIYQELVAELRPDVIVECGTYGGGSALFLASMCDLVRHGRVVTIDVAVHQGRPTHPRITYLHGSSTDPAVLDAVRSEVSGAGTVMVILDSDHRQPHVSEELRCYSPLVTTGSYLVVEDTNINGHPVLHDFGPGPREALDAFLAGTDEFEVDDGREKFFLSFNPGGYLRRVEAGCDGTVGGRGEDDRVRSPS